MPALDKHFQSIYLGPYGGGTGAQGMKLQLSVWEPAPSLRSPAWLRPTHRSGLEGTQAEGWQEEDREDPSSRWKVRGSGKNGGGGQVHPLHQPPLGRRADLLCDLQGVPGGTFAGGVTAKVTAPCHTPGTCWVEATSDRAHGVPRSGSADLICTGRAPLVFTNF